MGLSSGGSGDRPSGTARAIPTHDRAGHLMCQDRFPQALIDPIVKINHPSLKLLPRVKAGWTRAKISRKMSPAFLTWQRHRKER